MIAVRLSRRSLLRTSVAAAVLALARSPLAFGLADAAEGEEVVPFLDPQPIDPKRPMLKWEDLTDWLTPEDRFFDVSHYGTAKVPAEGWKLRIEGLVDKPLSLSLDDLKARPRQEAPVDAGMLGQRGGGQLHGRDRQRPLGGHAAGAAAQGVRRQVRGGRGGLLGGRPRQGEGPQEHRVRGQLRPQPVGCPTPRATRCCWPTR